MHGRGEKYFISVLYAIEALLERVMKSTICNYWSLVHYVCVVKRVSTYLHRTKQVENQAGLLVGQIQNFQSDPHKFFFERTIINKSRSIIFTFPKQIACA